MSSRHLSHADGSQCGALRPARPRSNRLWSPVPKKDPIKHIRVRGTRLGSLAVAQGIGGLLRNLSAGRKDNLSKVSLSPNSEPPRSFPKLQKVRNEKNIPPKSDYFPQHAMIQVLRAASMR